MHNISGYKAKERVVMVPIVFLVVFVLLYFSAVKQFKLEEK